MFKQTFNFSYQRHGFKEALGFYVVHLIIAMMLGMVLGALWGGGQGSFAQGFQKGVRAGQIIAVIYSLGLALLILIKKQILGGAKNLFLALLAGILAALSGGLLGLVPAAYLTTLPAKQAGQQAQ